MGNPSEKTKTAAKTYIQAFERLALTQHAMLDLSSEDSNENLSIDPEVWELIGLVINETHGEEAYNMVPIVMLAVDIYLYAIDKLGEEDFLDVVNRMDECIQSLKRDIQLHLAVEKEKGGGWIN